MQAADSYLSDFDFAVEPYVGCNFGCRYCFVPERSAGETGRPVDRWGLWREQSALPAVEAELAHRASELTGARLCLAGATDAWQPAERKYGLTRRVLEILSDGNVGFLLASTRSPIILRDLDLLRRFGDRLLVAVSIGTDLEAVARAVEPQAPSFAERLATIDALRRAGVNVRISVAPVLDYGRDFFADLMTLGLVLWLDMPDRRTPAAATAHIAGADAVMRLVGQLREQYGSERVTYGREQFSGRRRFGGRP